MQFVWLKNFLQIFKSFCSVYGSKAFDISNSARKSLWSFETMHFSARILTASTCSLVDLPGWYAACSLGILSANRSQIRFSSMMGRILRRIDNSIIGLRLSQGSSVFFGLSFCSGRSIPVLISLGKSPVSAVVFYMSSITLCIFSSAYLTNFACRCMLSLLLLL